MSLKDKVLAMQLRTQLRKFAFHFPPEDREKYIKAADTKEEVFTACRNAGITQQQLNDLDQAWLTMAAITEKHKSTLRKAGVKV